ncbi:Fungal specific transcription factor domain [Ceratobasidium sp. AG-Ba]|nr:Fungal specific transcription factor domain [Ceratobasidium sp. AG-Ba]
MAGKKALPVLLPNGTPPTQANSGPPPRDSGKQVLRVNRACNACRKQKMRCEGPENPPCARCKAAGTQRIRSLETQFATMQGTLMDILSELRRPQPTQSSSASVPDDSPRQAPKDSPAYSHSPASTPAPDPPTPANAPHRPALGYQYQPQLSQQLPSLQSVLPHHYQHSPSGFSRPHSHGYQGSSHHPPPPPHLHSSNSYHSRRLPDPVSPYRPAILSGITSAANSDDEGDIPSSALLAPIGVLNDLASVAAQSDPSRHGLKRKRGVEGPSPASRFRRTSSLSSRRSPPPLRTESTSGTNISEIAPEPEPEPEPQKEEAVEEERAPERERDAIERGIVSEAEAAELHRIYFTGCYRVLVCFLPSSVMRVAHDRQAVFNERVDTLESLRARSPFLLNCILMAASKARDGGSPPSPTQLALVRECSRMAKEYLFGPLKSVEIVQGLLLIAGWSHSTGPTGWLAAGMTLGHAIRYGVELGLHKALPRLARRKISGGGDTEVERALVTAARTWCGLYVFGPRISFGTGRCAARDILLKHPLSIPTDARLVSTCELMTLQSKIHDSLGSLDDPVNEDRVIEVLRQSILDLDAWLAEWATIMKNLGLDSRDLQFFHSSAQIQMLYAHLFHHCIALRNVHTVADAKALRPEMKQIALRAIDYAQSAIKVCLENHEYRLGLRYAISYSHTCAAFAGAFLLRLTRLFPEDLDVHAMIVMVEQLAHLLDEVPAGRFARSLFQMIKVSQERLRAKQAASSASPPTLAPTLSHERTNPQTQPPVSYPHVPGTGMFGPGMEYASDMTHGLLSLEGDWPAWIQNSIYGDLPLNGSIYETPGVHVFEGVPFGWDVGTV